MMRVMNFFRATCTVVALSSAAALDAQTIPTTMSLTANPTSVYPGQASLLTATVSVPKGAPPVPDGYVVTFYPTGTPGDFMLGYLSGGVATTTVTPTVNGAAGGTVSYTASFAQGEYPDPVYIGSSASVIIRVEAIETNALRAGQYAFLIQGNLVHGNTVEGETAAVGTVTLDGSGQLTGVEDINGSSNGISSGATALPLSGSYSFSSKGIGTLKLISTHGTQNFNIFLPNPALPTTPTAGTLVETDEGAIGRGVILMQQAVNLPYASGTYSLDLQGEAAGGFGHDGGPVLAAGQITFGASGQGGPVSGTVSETIGLTVVPGAGVSGTYTPPDPATGRVLFTLMPSSREYQDEPRHFVGYTVDSGNILVLSVDPHSSFMLLSGRLHGPD